VRIEAVSKFFESICFLLLHQSKHARERLRNLAMSCYYYYYYSNGSSSAFYNTTNCPLPPDLQKLVRFWYLPPGNDVPEYANSSGYWPSSAVCLWLVSLWTLTAFWTLILGNTHFGSRYRRWLGLRSPTTAAGRAFFAAREAEADNLSALSLSGSVFLLLAASLASAGILHSSGPDSSLSDLFGAWLVRPLPSMLVLCLALVSPESYIDNAFEMLVAETCFGLLSVWPFGDVAQNTRPMAGDAQSYLYENPTAALGVRIMRAGSAVGLLAWIILLLSIVPLAIQGTAPRQTPESRSTLFVFCFCYNFVKVLSSFLLWGGALVVSPDIYAPGRKGMVGVTILWAVVPAIDLLWRHSFRKWHNGDSVELQKLVGLGDSDEGRRPVWIMSE
jgi:hypothetical protein